MVSYFLDFAVDNIKIIGVQQFLHIANVRHQLIQFFPFQLTHFHIAVGNLLFNII